MTYPCISSSLESYAAYPKLDRFFERCKTSKVPVSLALPIVVTLEVNLSVENPSQGYNLLPELLSLRDSVRVPVYTDQQLKSYRKTQHIRTVR